jgi:hypothetical protein
VTIPSGFIIFEATIEVSASPLTIKRVRINQICFPRFVMHGINMSICQEKGDPTTLPNFEEILSSMKSRCAGKVSPACKFNAGISNEVKII